MAEAAVSTAEGGSNRASVTNTQAAAVDAQRRENNVVGSRLDFFFFRSYNVLHLSNVPEDWVCAACSLKGHGEMIFMQTRVEYPVD
jgi:hypothetical protein